MKNLKILFLAVILLFSSCEKDSTTDPNNNNNNSGTGCNSTQCYGTTQDGTRCQRMTTNCSSLCWQHD